MDSSIPISIGGRSRSIASRRRASPIEAPVLLKTGSLHEAFARKYIGKCATALEIYNCSLVFTGRTLMPKALNTEQQVVDYVAKTRGAVGYVSAAAALGVNVVDVW
jgi:hypothetical protein